MFHRFHRENMFSDLHVFVDEPIPHKIDTEKVRSNETVGNHPGEEYTLYTSYKGLSAHSSYQWSAKNGISNPLQYFLERGRHNNG